MHALPPRWLTLSLFCLLLGTGRAAASDFDDAVTLFKAKHYPDARAAFEKLAAADPQNGPAHYYLGRIALYRDDPAGAAAELEKATAGDARNSDYFYWLGSSYGLLARQTYSLGSASKCRIALLKAVELDPDNIEARAELVTFYRQAPFFVGGSLARAHAQAEEIKKRNPVRGALAEAEICIAERKYDEAFDAFESLLKEHPEQITALYQIGFIAATTGQRLDRGEAALKEYLTHTPGDTQPTTAYAHYRLGNIYEKKNEPAAARAEYQAALNLDPKFGLAAKALAKLQ
ncbi:MAG TPA: tetratricopeptide repeat protein [Opitutaceae bacterium]|jgi:tetratricopeptide (TPR) repeat protein|nr:tetratricopeptide repeat protein [Opitutaceae bacterium]